MTVFTFYNKADCHTSVASTEMTYQYKLKLSRTIITTSSKRNCFMLSIIDETILMRVLDQKVSNAVTDEMLMLATFPRSLFFFFCPEVFFSES